MTQPNLSRSQRAAAAVTDTEILNWLDHPSTRIRRDLCDTGELLYDRDNGDQEGMTLRESIKYVMKKDAELKK